MMRKFLIFLGITCALLAAVALLKDRSTPTEKPSSDLLKEATASEVLDHVRSLKSPLVLVNFWASWCEPCKREFPHILSLKEELAGRGFKVVFVSIDTYKEFQDADRFLRENKIKFPSYYRGSQGIEFITGIFPKWEGAVPASVLFDEKLEIVDSWEGGATLEEFRQQILPHLRGT